MRAVRFISVVVGSARAESAQAADPGAEVLGCVVPQVMFAGFQQ